MKELWKPQGDYLDPEEKRFRKRLLRELKAVEREVEADPNRDYFGEVRHSEPKRQIGEYVRSCGFNVPLISDQNDWEEAFRTGVAMLRSEQWQDYGGAAGVLSSAVIDDTRLRNGELGHYSLGATHEYRQKIGALMSEGLRDGTLDPTEFMKLFYWDYNVQRLYEEMNELRAGFSIDPSYATVSRWRYISGVNLKVFRDPNVDGRYHFSAGRYNGWKVDKGAYNNETIEKESPSREILKVEIPVAKIIQYYEAIRTLPRFDQRQAPLLELQLDTKGQLHFLQYLKTGLMIDPVDEFDLPASKDATRFINVRGATHPEGKDIKIYMAPKKVTKAMKGQGFYFDVLKPYSHGFAQQYLSMLGSLVVHWAYVGLRTNHYSSAPMIRPELAMGLHNRQDFKSMERAAGKLYELTVLVHGSNVYDQRPDHNVYIDAHVTANGREATLETDFEPHFEENM